MQTTALCHMLRGFLNQWFEGCWIGKAGLQASLLRSPNMMFLDCLYRHMIFPWLKQIIPSPRCDDLAVTEANSYRICGGQNATGTFLVYITFIMPFLLSVHHCFLTSLVPSGWYSCPIWSCSSEVLCLMQLQNTCSVKTFCMLSHIQLALTVLLT
jgi:hypothetical protein